MARDYYPLRWSVYVHAEPKTSNKKTQQLDHCVRHTFILRSAWPAQLFAPQNMYTTNFLALAWAKNINGLFCNADAKNHYYY